MDKLIQTSLFQNRSCRLPGIGTLTIITNSAETDLINLTIKSPVHTIIFTEEQQEANLFNKFSSTSEFLNTSLQESGNFHLNGVGTFTKISDGKIRFLGVALPRELTQPVTAERVVKQNIQRKTIAHIPATKQNIPEKQVQVVTPIANREPAVEIATEPQIKLVKKKRSYWVVWAFVLTITAAGLISYYFSHSLSKIPSFGNSNTIDAAPANTDSHHEIK
ncbi:MAG TPA: hypothetical protein VK718_02050 [Ferruginibacter sp.]|jgi:hypothetical protein|nr:hypothetical protein [Ferruginibacter sp.]